MRLKGWARGRKWKTQKTKAFLKEEMRKWNEHAQSGSGSNWRPRRHGPHWTRTATQLGVYVDVMCSLENYLRVEWETKWVHIVLETHRNERLGLLNFDHFRCCCCLVSRWAKTQRCQDRREWEKFWNIDVLWTEKSQLNEVYEYPWVLCKLFEFRNT